VIENEEKERSTVVIVGTAEVSYDRKHDGIDVDIEHTDGVKLSFDSPIGTAIRGKKAGEVVKVRLSNGRYDFKIISVK